MKAKETTKKFVSAVWKLQEIHLATMLHFYKMLKGFLNLLKQSKSLVVRRMLDCERPTVATNVLWLGEVPPCRMLNYSTKACGGILPNHCYKPFLFVFGLTI